MSSAGVKLSPDRVWISLGVAITSLISCASGAVWIALNMQGFKYSTDALNQSVNRIETRVDSILSDTIKRRDFENFLELLKARNPTLVIPDFR